jgi:hypothetical protein
MRRMITIVLFVAAAAVSGGCYVKQDGNGQWWACETTRRPTASRQDARRSAKLVGW